MDDGFVGATIVVDVDNVPFAAADVDGDGNLAVAATTARIGIAA